MRPLWVGLLLFVAVAGYLPVQCSAAPAERVEIYGCDFDQRSDTDFDGWPNGWQRELSARYPHYLKIGIQRPVRDPEDGGPEQVLRAELDGGAVWVRSPTIPVNPLFMYTLEVTVRTSKLERSAASISLSFLDGKQQSVETFRSEAIQQSKDWQTLTIGPFLPGKATAALSQISLHVEPKVKSGDLRGWVEFGRIRLYRLPRITLTSNRLDRIYFDPERPEIVCQASGFHDARARVVFELIDIDGKVTLRDELPLRRNETGEPANPTVRERNSPAVYSGEVKWRPQITQQGYYRVRVQMPGELGIVNRRELSLIMLQPLPTLQQGEFGWSLPNGEEKLAISDLAELAGNSGIHWIKLPVWSAGTSRTRADQLIWFAERMSLKRVNLVGMLSDPPEQVRNAVSGGQTDLAAGVFSAPEQIWFPTLEPMVSRLSARVQHWQLGNDDDHSFVGFQDGPARIQLVRKLFSRFGQHLHFGVGWDWLRELPTDHKAWETVLLNTQPVLSADEQTRYLEQTQQANFKRWVMLEPLPADQYDLDTRIADLLQRMISAKVGQAAGIFLPRLCDDRTGLLDSEGSGGPLYIPWRTACYHLAGSQYVGALPWRDGLRNALFVRNEQYTLAVWSDEPKLLEWQLGNNFRLLNCWGREITPLRENGVTKIPVGPTPLFIVDVNGGLARFQMQVRFADHRWASQFGQAQSNTLLLSNPFDQAISGTVRLVWPQEWHSQQREINFKIAPRDSVQLPFDVTLPLYAGTGKQDIGLDFELSAERLYRFQTKREIEIGLDDLFAEFITTINGRDELEVEQRLTNRTNEAVNFKCYLYAPDRKRMTLQIQDQGQGIDVKTFILARGSQLLGQDIQVRLVEVGGDRVLNYVIKVKQ